jgi:hypothetical protein
VIFSFLAFALYYAYTALVKTMHDAGILDIGHLFKHLAGATRQLRRIGEEGAANALGSISENLSAI